MNNTTKSGQYQVIKTTKDFLSMKLNPSGYYILNNNIDIGGIDAEGLFPCSSPFAGRLDGNGYTIESLTINATGKTLDGAGLFGCIAGDACLENIRLTNVSVTGWENAGGLVGLMKGGKVMNCSVESGWVHANMYVGGLVGRLDSGTITGCNAGRISGAFAGGLAGVMLEGKVFGSNAGEIIGRPAGTGSLVGLVNYGSIVGYNEGVNCSQPLVGRVLDNAEIIGYNVAPVKDLQYICGLVGAIRRKGKCIGYVSETEKVYSWSTYIKKQGISKIKQTKPLQDSHRKEDYPLFTFGSKVGQWIERINEKQKPCVFLGGIHK